MLEQRLLEAVKAVAVVEGGAAGQGEDMEEPFLAGFLFAAHHSVEGQDI